MSKESLEQFMLKREKSKDLQTAIGQEIDAESLIALGAEHGFEFSLEDIQQSSELSEDELDAVAGGASTSRLPTGVFDVQGVMVSTHNADFKSIAGGSYSAYKWAWLTGNREIDGRVKGRGGG